MAMQDLTPFILFGLISIAHAGVETPAGDATEIIVKIRIESSLQERISREDAAELVQELREYCQAVLSRVENAYNLSRNQPLFPNSIDIIRAHQYYRLKIPSGMTVMAVLSQMRNDPDLEWAEPGNTWKTQPALRDTHR